HLTPGNPVDGSLLLGPTGSLTGNGVVSGDVINDGIVSPGNSPGIQKVNSFNQAASGTLIIQVYGKSAAGAADGFDQLQVATSATLNGTLQVQLAVGR